MMRTAAFWNKNATQFARACCESRYALIVPGEENYVSILKLHFVDAQAVQ